MTDTDQASPAATTARCTVCPATLEAVGQPERWRMYGLIRDLTGSGGAMHPRGSLFVFCPECTDLLDKRDGPLGHPAFAEVVRRAPGQLTEGEYHQRALLLARIFMGSQPLTLDQLDDFRKTFD